MTTIINWYHWNIWENLLKLAKNAFKFQILLIWNSWTAIVYMWFLRVGSCELAHFLWTNEYCFFIFKSHCFITILLHLKLIFIFGGRNFILFQLTKELLYASLLCCCSRLHLPFICHIRHITESCRTTHDETSWKAS